MRRVSGGANVDKLEGEFVGAGGTFYVLAQLAFQRFHACLTLGNASRVDIVVADAKSGKAVCIQVKTAWSALRRRGRGKARLPHHFEWTLGRKAAELRREDFFFAFVDLKKLKEDTKPDIYLMSACAIADYCDKDKVKTAKWVRFHRKVELLAPYKIGGDNDWTLLRAALLTPR